MARFTSAGRATIVGTNLLPLVSLYGTNSGRLGIVEVGLCNTTTTAVTVALQRLTTTGTQGVLNSILTEDVTEAVAVGAPRAGHTAGPTITVGQIRQWTLGAAIGAGVIWTWPDNHPLAIPALTTSGIGVTIPIGTGQILDYSITWLE